jgi:nucleotide-binding universal stress UspA family protein
MSRTITRILVPTDFSATSEVALDYAITVASRFGASLHLLHVVDDPFVGGAFGSEVYITSVPTMRVHLVDEAETRLCRLLPLCRRVAARSQVRVGRPPEVIREVAEEQGIDLIVMGTHGRTGMAHLLLGSVAEKIVREAPCPVLTVRGETGALVGAEREHFECELVPTE